MNQLVKSPPPVPESAPSGARSAVVGATLIALAAGLATWNALESPFILDDHSKIVQNTDIRRLEDLPEKLVYPYQRHQVLERNDPSRPLVFLIWALVYHFEGLDPLPYHLLNLLFHALSGILVFLLARRALGSLKVGVGAWVPVAAGLFFVVTPIQVGTVIYAYALSDVLGSCLMLLALYLHARQDPPGRLSVALAALCLALAVFAKQAAVVAPLLLVAWDFCFPVGGRMAGLRERWRPYVVYAVIAVAYTLFRFAYFGEIGDLEGRSNTYPPLEYAWAQPAVVWRYLGLSLVPWNLAIDHYVVPSTDPDFTKALALGGLVLMAVAVVWCVRRSGSAGRLALFAALFYLLAVAPTSSIVPTVDLMVERRAYLANFALVLLLAGAYGWLARRLAQASPSRMLRAAPVGVLLVHLAALGAVSVSRNEVFRTNRAVWEDVLRIYPESPRALNNLANLYLEAKEYDQAREIYERLVRRDGRDYLALGNLGHFYDQEGTPHYDLKKAASFFEAALQVNADYAAAHYHLGRVHHKEGQASEAERHYLETLRLNPNYVLAHNNLGLLYYHQGRLGEARRRYEAALLLDPSCEPARANLRLLEQSPHPLGATEISPALVPAELLVRLYESALAKEPSNLIVRRKFADLCRERKLPCATEQYRKLLEADPGNQEVRRILKELEAAGLR